jgi:hypothetical protein
MSFHLEVSGERFTFSEVDLPTAIKGLREALGKSQESMARVLAVAFPPIRNGSSAASHPTPSGY